MSERKRQQRLVKTLQIYSFLPPPVKFTFGSFSIKFAKSCSGLSVTRIIFAEKIIDTRPCLVLYIEGDVSCNGRPCKGMTKRRAMEDRLRSQIATLKMNINMAHITEKTENCELVANCDRLVAVDNIEPLIKVIRGQQVMIDRDLATLYGVETKRLNEQVKRNIKRFPEDFMFQLTKDECLRSQICDLKRRTRAVLW